MKWSFEKNDEAQQLWAEIKLDVDLIAHHSRQILIKIEKFEYMPRRAIHLEMVVRKILTMLGGFLK